MQPAVVRTSVLLCSVLLLISCSRPTVSSKQTQPVEVQLVEERVPVPMMSAPAPMPAAPFIPPVEVNVQMPAPSAPPVVVDTSRFPRKDANPSILTEEQPVSTFSVDVDTASYAVLRRYLTEGNLPHPDAVRVEEMVNYFPYRYARPESREQPFAITTEVMPSPWNAERRLVHIALRGYDIVAAQRPPINVVLLIDVSGSMGPEDRLPLLKKSLRLFTDQLRADDHVAIATYAGESGVVLQPTPGSQKQKIAAAIDALGAGGGTAGEAGLQEAYALAQRHFDKRAVNRVILATDGDFNIGISDPTHLEKLIAAKRKTGIYLSILGVGLDNLNDALTQRLAQSGNGNAAYIDSVLEARKVLSEEFGSTMFPIANDVKVQVEFNPAKVAAYRLIGYETRMLERQDFNDDKIDAGDMGAGHTVTAIYEITPVGAKGSPADPLRYQKKRKAAAKGGGDELCFVKTRYKLPGEQTSRLITHPVLAKSLRKNIAEAPEDQRFAVAVAAFGQRLRGESQLGDYGYAEIAQLARSARGADADGYRAEFIKLVQTAQALDGAGGSPVR